MFRDRTFNRKKEATVFHQERFYPSGNYTWKVPEGCESVDVFLVARNVSKKMRLDTGMVMVYRLFLDRIYKSW